MNARPDQLVPVRAWYDPRAWASAIARALTPTEKPKEFLAGSDFTTDVPAQPNFDPRLAMSSFGTFAWVVACTEIVAGDVASLPLRVSPAGKSRRTARFDDHPALPLLRRPSPGVTGGWLRRQLCVDYLLTGTAYELPTFRAKGKPPSNLFRAHPARVTIVPGTNGIPYAFEYDGGGQRERYGAEAMLYFRGLSWEDDPANQFGQGRIRALYRDLVADQAMQDRAMKSASKGRPDGIISPDTPDESWTPVQVKQFTESLARTFEEASGGVAVIGRKLGYERLGWSESELQTLEQRNFVRQNVSAVFGVPPVRLGLTDGVNYATSDQQMLLYWGDTVRSVAAVFEEVWSAWASRTWPEFGEVEIWHDTSAVPVLAAMEGARIDRVAKHIRNGMDPNDAYAYEGLDDAPKVKPPSSAQAAPPAPTVTPKAEASRAPDPPIFGADAPTPSPSPSLRVALLSRAGMAPDSELDGDDARAEAWRLWRETVHDPAERAVEAAALGWLGYLRGAVDARMSALIAATPAMRGPVTRNIVDDVMRALFHEAEDTDAGWEAFQVEFLRLWREAFRRTETLLDLDLTIDPTRMSREVDEHLGSLIQGAYAETVRDVRIVVLAGLDRGLSMSGIQAEIQASTTFGPDRALLIARTEATRSREAGNLAAYEAGANEGADIEIEWMSSRDVATRAAHMALDGQRVRPGAMFVVPAVGRLGMPVEPSRLIGQAGAGPGQFADPAMVCNCRCTTVARRRRPKA